MLSYVLACVGARGLEECNTKQANMRQKAKGKGGGQS
jgi:hypothetical protein